MKFVLTDDSLDRDSERILVSGLNTDNFEKNPIMLYQHRQDDWWTNTFAPLPIGYWKNIKREGNQLTAEPEFNDTELGQEVKALVEHGTLRACSIGFRAISFSSEPALMLPGQKYSTITSAELLEASIVMIPANPNAVVVKSFSKDGKKYDVSGESTVSDEQFKKLDGLAKNFFKSQSQFNDMKKLFAEVFGDIQKDIATIKEKLFSNEKANTSIDVKALDEVKQTITSIEKSMGDLKAENKELTDAKEAAEGSVKALTEEKENLVKEKAALTTDKEKLEKEVEELKAANLKLSGGGSADPNPAIEKTDKNDSTPQPEETQEQKVKRLAQMASKIGKE